MQESIIHTEWLNADRPKYYGTLEQVEARLSKAGFVQEGQNEDTKRSRWKGIFDEEHLVFEVFVSGNRAVAAIENYAPKSGERDTTPARRRVCARRKTKSRPNTKTTPIRRMRERKEHQRAVSKLTSKSQPLTPFNPVAGSQKKMPKLNVVAKQIEKERGYSRQYAHRLASKVLEELTRLNDEESRRQMDDFIKEQKGKKQSWDCIVEQTRKADMAAEW